MSELPNDPGLRALLGELLCDADARLLHVSRAVLRQRACGGSTGAASTAPFLRRAERRLLEVYREEVARLLYHLALVHRAAARPMGAHYADCVLPLPEAGALELRTRKLARFWARDLDDLAAVDLLRACIGRGRRVSPAQLTAAALRIAPSARVRIAHAADLAAFEGLRPQAERMLHGVLAEQVNGELASYALENLSLVRPSDHAALAVLHARAVRSDPTRVVPSLAWLRHSAHGRSLAGVLRAAEQVDHLVSEDHPALAWYLRASARGSGPGTEGRTRLASAAAEHVGPVARRVLLCATPSPACAAPAVSDAR